LTSTEASTPSPTKPQQLKPNETPNRGKLIKDPGQAGCANGPADAPTVASAKSPTQLLSRRHAQATDGSDDMLLMLLGAAVARCVDPAQLLQCAAAVFVSAQACLAYLRRPAPRLSRRPIRRRGGRQAGAASIFRGPEGAVGERLQLAADVVVCSWEDTRRELPHFGECFWRLHTGKGGVATAWPRARLSSAVASPLWRRPILGGFVLLLPVTRSSRSSSTSGATRKSLSACKWSSCVLKVVVVFEGRDTAGKGGTIKRITEKTNPRVVRTVALGTPTERERTQWYFQRYVPHLPAGGEMVLFDRSWYNRAGVERVMGFCTQEEYEEFMRTCPQFERDLLRSGIILVKYWLSVSDEEQERRFKARLKDPAKQWKLSGMDLEARRRWVDYAEAKDDMFAYTDTSESPWYVVEADDKRTLRLNLISHLLSLIPYEDIQQTKIKLPPRQSRAYVRPPQTDQNYVPVRYQVGSSKR